MKIGIAKIGNIKAGDVLDLVTYLVEKCAKLPNNPNPERKSGYFTLRNRKGDSRLIVQVQINECPSKKVHLFKEFSYEKSERLHGRNILLGELSSWESRNVKDEKYGGAIATQEFILSFSGLPELADEAVMLVTALFLGWANYQEIATIAKLSNNPFFDELKEKEEANSPWKPYVPEK